MTDSRNEHEFDSIDQKDGLPNILLWSDDIAGPLDHAEAALVRGGANIFQMHGRLVQLVRHDAAADEDCTEEPLVHSPVRRPNGAVVIKEVGPYRLIELLTSAAHWFKWDGRSKPRKPDPDNPDKKGAWKKARPTIDIARHIEERGQWTVRNLRAAVEAPTLRLDASILQTPGYDRRSQLFFDPNGVAFPPISKSPTLEDAAAALDPLLEVIRDFPFVPTEGEEWGQATASRSVALSLMLTALVRRSLATAPAHAVIAPTPGTGKTKLAEIGSALATGRTPTSISYGKSQEEFEKRLFSVLLSGDAVIIVDNIEADEISSDEFCTVLTSESVKNRILGLSKMAEVPTSALFVLNGNNITFAGDIVDRVVACNLDARMEDPKRRTFDFEPVAHTIANRPELVAAGLTILRAHAVAGFPGAAGLTPSRFPDWDRVVRGALVWLGQPDPQLTRDKIAVVDPERDMRAAVLRAWREAVGYDQRVSVPQLVERARADLHGELDAFQWPSPFPDEASKDLHTALTALTNGKSLDSPWLGRHLKKLAGRITAGEVLHIREDSSNGNRYWLSRHTEEEQF